MKRLILHEGETHYPHHLFGPDSTMPIDPINTKRDIFVVNLKIALILLMRNRVGHKRWQPNVPKTEDELLKEYSDVGLPPA
jgi:hypothetical protein